MMRPQPNAEWPAGGAEVFRASAAGFAYKHASGFNYSRRGDPKPVQRLSSRSTAAPIARPAITSLVQCANRTIRVRTRPAPIDQARLRFAGGSSVAADASAPTWMAWPDGKASKGFPENGTP